MIEVFRMRDPGPGSNAYRAFHARLFEAVGLQARRTVHRAANGRSGAFRKVDAGFANRLRTKPHYRIEGFFGG